MQRGQPKSCRQQRQSVITIIPLADKLLCQRAVNAIVGRTGCKQCSKEELLRVTLAPHSVRTSRGDRSCRSTENLFAYLINRPQGIFSRTSHALACCRRYDCSHLGVALRIDLFQQTRSFLRQALDDSYGVSDFIGFLAKGILHSLTNLSIVDPWRAIILSRDTACKALRVVRLRAA